MTREQAINYLFCSGMSAEQVQTVVKALEQEPCECKSEDNLCDTCDNKACIFQSGIKRSKCDFYTSHLEPDNCGNHIVQIPNEIKVDDCISRNSVLKIMDDIETAIHDGEGFDYSGWSAEVYMLPSVYPKNEALEQEPTPKNDLGVDCISRAEAIKCLECDFDITGKENMKTVVNYINSAHDKIVNLPRVKQEPKAGHWIEDAEQHHVEKTYHCSECGHGAWGEYEKTEYCGGCGAKMVEPQESEET